MAPGRTNEKAPQGQGPSSSSGSRLPTCLQTTSQGWALGRRGALRKPALAGGTGRSSAAAPTMFPSPVTSTPFSVKDILSLEQHPSGLASLELSALGSPSSSCMLATFKQESYPAEDAPLAEAPAGLAKGSGSTFPGPFFAKSYVEIEPNKEPKESQKGNRGAEGEGGQRGSSARVAGPKHPLPSRIPGEEGLFRGGHVRGGVCGPGKQVGGSPEPASALLGHSVLPLRMRRDSRKVRREQ